MKIEYKDKKMGIGSSAGSGKMTQNYMSVSNESRVEGNNSTSESIEVCKETKYIFILSNGTL